MIPVPERLYDRATLFDRWDPADHRSWAASRDGTTYRRAVADGLRAPRDLEVAHARADHDTAITTLVRDRVWAPGCRPAAIMGGHAAIRGGTTYRAAARLGAALSRRGMTVLTGGGPGAMEATHLGARLALQTDERGVDEAVDRIAHDEDRRSFPLGSHDLLVDGEWSDDALRRLHRWQVPAFELARDTDDGANDTLGIPTWMYGHEPPTPLATHHGKYFENSLREDGLLALAITGVLYLPGSAGTVQEVFQDLAQNHYRTVRNLFSPMVFVDLDGHWTERFPIGPIIDGILRDEDRHLVHFTDDLDEAVDFVDGHGIAATH